MSLTRYLRSNLFQIVSSLFFLIAIILILSAFKVNYQAIIAVIVLLLMNLTLVFLFDFWRKSSFYRTYLANLEKIDQKYLISELINRPDFYEGQILYDSLYQIDKSMIENINQYKYNLEEFKEYLELWIHEVKIPISSLTLMAHNDSSSTKCTTQINRLDSYIDQILYYIRSQYAEKDFIIQDVPLDKIVQSVALHNKDELLSHNITLHTDLHNLSATTDAKWLEFILNQIINNSIKYCNQISPKINIIATETKNKIQLKIQDNGIGISPSDLPRIFDKSFTGNNGRNNTKSTGIGLYLVKKLCHKLGHTVSAESSQNTGTTITISFGKNSHYKPL